MSVSIPSFISRKFTFWTFASMMMLVFVHGYNLDLRYLQPATTVSEPLTANSFIQYFLSNGLFRFFIPMLFAISGYLFALKDKQPYKTIIRKRVRTLLLPYLIWSAAGLLLTYAIELTPYGRSIVETTHLMQFGNNRILLHDYKWHELLLRWILIPVPYQLWFLRVLFIYNLVYPALRWCVMKGAKIFFPVIILLWIADFGTLLFEAEGLLFFSLGIWMQKNNFNIQLPGKWLRPLPYAVVFISVAVIKTVLAFKGFALLGNTIYPVLLLMYKIVVFSGLATAWFGCDVLVKWCMNKKWFVWLTSFSFFIFVTHAPLIAYAINAVFPVVQHIPDYRILTYLFLPLSILTLSICAGALIRFIAPKTFGVLTGGRGN